MLLSRCCFIWLLGNYRIAFHCFLCHLDFRQLNRARCKFCALYFFSNVAIWYWFSNFLFYVNLFLLLLSKLLTFRNRVLFKCIHNYGRPSVCLCCVGLVIAKA